MTGAGRRGDGRGDRRGDRGSVTVTTVGFLVVALLMLAVVVNATRAYLQHQELTHLADGAAIAAADGLDLEQFYADRTVRLDPRQATALMGDYLAGADARIVGVSVTADTVTVALERTVDLTFVPDGWLETATVSAEASAQLLPGP